MFHDYPIYAVLDKFDGHSDVYRTEWIQPLGATPPFHADIHFGWPDNEAETLTARICELRPDAPVTVAERVFRFGEFGHTVVRYSITPTNGVPFRLEIETPASEVQAIVWCDGNQGNGWQQLVFGFNKPDYWDTLP